MNGDRRIVEQPDCVSTWGVLFALIFFSFLVLKDALDFYGFGALATGGIAIGIVGSLVGGLLNGGIMSIGRLILRHLFAKTLVVGYLSSIVYSYMSTGIVNISPFYIGFFVAFIIYCFSKDSILLFIAPLAVINILVQIYEQALGSLLFPTISAIDNLTLDAASYSIGVSAVRTKGLFQGPLHGVSIFLLAILLKQNSFILHILFVFASYMAGARLGLALSIIYLIIFAQKKLYDNGSARLITTITILVIVEVTIISYDYILEYLDNDRITFIAMAFDFDNNESNITRIDAWYSAIATFFSYDIAGMLFGNFDYIRLFTMQRSAESDWLRMLVDNGLICFISYGMMFRLIFSLSKCENSRWSLAHLIIIIVSMNLYPCLGWLTAATTFWVFALSVIDRSSSEAAVPRRNNYSIPLARTY